MLTNYFGKLSYMPALADRMKELESQFGLTVGEIAKLCGVTSSAVSQWFGKGDKPSKEIGSVRAAVMLERRTGWSALWIAYGEGPKICASGVVGGEQRATQKTDVPTALVTLGEAIESATEGREDAISLLRVFIGNPTANDALPDIIARRLAGEIAEPAQRRSNGTH